LTTILPTIQPIFLEIISDMAPKNDESTKNDKTEQISYFAAIFRSILIIFLFLFAFYASLHLLNILVILHKIIFYRIFPLIYNFAYIKFPSMIFETFFGTEYLYESMRIDYGYFQSKFTTLILVIYYKSICTQDP
jgi:hypothetical protein